MKTCNQLKVHINICTIQMFAIQVTTRTTQRAAVAAAALVITINLVVMLKTK